MRVLCGLVSLFFMAETSLDSLFPRRKRTGPFDPVFLALRCELGDSPFPGGARGRGLDDSGFGFSPGASGHLNGVGFVGDSSFFPIRIRGGFVFEVEPHFELAFQPEAGDVGADPLKVNGVADEVCHGLSGWGGAGGSSPVSPACVTGIPPVNTRCIASADAHRPRRFGDPARCRWCGPGVAAFWPRLRWVLRRL